MSLIDLEVLEQNVVPPENAEAGPTKGPERQWPEPLSEDALIGPLGQIVKRLEPHTEADPAGILFQGLVAFGNVIGRTAYFLAEADTHFCNMNTVLVGETAKARKGVSWRRVGEILGRVDPNWMTPASGLSSGEGLIYAVRDEAFKINNQGEEILADAGVADKRLLVVEEEFARVLQATRREGTTLSAVFRQAFDTGNLRILTRNCPVRSTGAHVSVVGHITASELARTLPEVECANGFANRILWVCVKRSKELPEGGRSHELDFSDIENQLRAAKACAAKGELRRDDEARELWCAVYSALSRGRPGLLGSVTSRAEAYVMRLATTFAAAESAGCIGLRHLRAGLEAWRYCQESAAYVFGRSVGDSDADGIFNALVEAGAKGLSRTEISKRVFSGNRTSDDIARALTLLNECGQARMVPAPTKGRAAEVWVAL